MPNYWWVNHKKTFREEISEGCLWSPQRERNGARNPAYENMRRIAPGDVIISYAYKQNRHVGRATDYAAAANAPLAFAEKAEAWDRSGWYVPVDWTALPTAVEHRAFWDELKPLLPAYSPVVIKTGHGAQKIYLAQVSEAVFDLIAHYGGLAPESLESQGLSGRTAASHVEAVETHLETVVSEDDLSGTVRDQVIAARRGQGQFRDAVLRLAAACRVTGLDHPQLLVASHIKPWRACTTAAERLDGANGLMLVPNIDRLFDRGFITFEDDGTVRVSPHITDAVLAALGKPDLRTQNVGTFTQAQRVYLAHHRAAVYLAP